MAKQTFLLLDRGEGNYIEINSSSECSIAEATLDYLQQKIENGDIYEACELDLVVVGPIYGGKCKMREVFFSEIPPTEPSYEVEFRDL